MMPRWAAASSWVRSMCMGRTECPRPSPHYHTERLSREAVATAATGAAPVRCESEAWDGLQGSGRRKDEGRAFAADKAILLGRVCPTTTREIARRCWRGRTCTAQG